MTDRDEVFAELDFWISRGYGDVPRTLIYRYGGNVPADVVRRCRSMLSRTVTTTSKGNSRRCAAYYRRNAERIKVQRRQRYLNQQKNS